MGRMIVVVRWYLVFILAPLALAGCGSDEGLASVEGKVTFNEQPLQGAVVEFQPAGSEGAPSSGKTDENGDYELMFSFDKVGVLTGEHLVSVSTAGTDFDEEGNEIERKEVLPPEYNTQTTLKRTVEPGNNTFNFDL